MMYETFILEFIIFILASYSYCRDKKMRTSFKSLVSKSAQEHDGSRASQGNYKLS